MVEDVLGHASRCLIYIALPCGLYPSTLTATDSPLPLLIVHFPSIRVSLLVVHCPFLWIAHIDAV